MCVCVYVCVCVLLYLVASQVAWWVKNLLAVKEVQAGVGLIRWHFPDGASGKELSASAGDVRDLGSIPGSGRTPGGGHGTHFSILAWKIPWTEEPGGQ